MAKEDAAVVEEEEGGGGGGGKKGLIITIVVAVLMLGIGAGGVWFVMSSKVDEMQMLIDDANSQLEQEMAPRREIKGDPWYMDFDPPLTVNISGDEVEHFLTVGITVLSYEKESFDALNNYRPMLRNSLVIMLGDAHYEDLLTPEGKERLRDLAKETIIGVLDDNEQLGDIAEVYFTKFLMQ